MKIFALCNSDWLGFATLRQLNQDGHLVGVGILKKHKSHFLPGLEEMGISADKVSLLEKDSWSTAVTEIIEKEAVEAVWALTFPYKVPGDLLNLPKHGFINFHFANLPKYKGADPIFWEFKNLEENGGITVHKMNEAIDEGPVILREPMPIMPGTNYGLHCQRLGGFAPTLIPKVISALENENFEYLQLEEEEAVCFAKPKEEDLTIDWQNHTAHQIESLVNGANPVYKGAATNIGMLRLRILEVTPVNMEGEIKAEPGQIVHADVIYGLVVACADMECIRITMAQTPEGYMSGVKLFTLGYMAGQKFGPVS